MSNKKELTQEEMIENANIAKVKERKKIKGSYFYSLGIFIFTLLMLVSTSVFLYYSYVHYTPPSSFIVLNADNKILEEASLKEDIMSEEAVSNLVNKWLTDIFSYHYLNLDEHGVKIKPYFSNDRSYSDFMNVFQDLRMQVKILEGKGIVNPIVISPLIVSNTRIYNDYQKVYQLKGMYVIELIFTDGKEAIRYEVGLNVSRQRLVDNPYGLAIETISLR